MASPPSGSENVTGVSKLSSDSNSKLELDDRITEFKKLKTDTAKMRFFKKNQAFFIELKRSYDEIKEHINVDINALNDVMVQHEKYTEFFEKKSDTLNVKKHIAKNPNEINLVTELGIIPHSPPYVNLSERTENIFQGKCVVKEISKFDGNFKEIVRGLTENLLSSKDKQIAADIKYLELLKKTSGGVSSSIL